MIVDTIQKQIQESFKGGDELRTTTLKLLSAALHNAEIAKIGKLTEEEEIAIVQREVKKRNDAIVLYKQGGALDRAEREQNEIVILQEFLPEQISESELEELVKAAISETQATDMKDMGKVIGLVKSKVGAKAQGSQIAEMVKKNLK